MNCSPHLFTTDPSEGFIFTQHIQDLRKMNVEQCNLEQPTVFIVMSGWNNKYNKDRPFHFKVPYSSHSNHRELERFVAAIRPENLVYHVTDRENC